MIGIHESRKPFFESTVAAPTRLPSPRHRDFSVVSSRWTKRRPIRNHSGDLKDVFNDPVKANVRKGNFNDPVKANVHRGNFNDPARANAPSEWTERVAGEEA